MTEKSSSYQFKEYLKNKVRDEFEILQNSININYSKIKKNEKKKP